jgi:DNA primase
MWQDTIKRYYKHKIYRDEIILKTCPYCDNRKFNLQISTSKGIFNCWACSAKGKVEKFFKDQNLDFDKTNWQSSAPMAGKPAAEHMDFSGFRPVEYDLHKKFLSSRGITREDIPKYNLMTTGYGRYKDKLIIPLKEGNEVVYFVSRDMFNKGRYCNPVINKKEHLLYYTGKKNSLSLYIVEGAFDAISLNKIGFSVAMLLGSSISKEQIDKIKRIGFKEVVVCLDGDLKKKALDLYKKLYNYGLQTKIVLIPGLDDPNDLYVADKDYLIKLLSNPKEITVKDQVEMVLCK